MGDDVLHLGVMLLVMVGKSLLFGRVHDGARDGMREVLLKTGGERQQLVLGHVLREGDHVREVRSGVGERARLVEDDGVDFGKRLEVAAALDDDASGRAFLHGGEDGERRRQAQRAAVVDEQHGGRAVQIARDEPDDGREREVEGHDRIGELERLALDARLHLLAFLDEADDLREARAVADARRTNADLAALDDGARKDGAARGAVHGERLARHRGLVHGGLAVKHHAVDGNDAARAHDDHVLGRHVGERLLAQFFVLADPDDVALHRELLGERGHRLPARVVLEHLAHAEQQDEQAGGLEVAAQERDDERGGVEHGDVETALEKLGDALADDRHGAEEGVGRIGNDGQERAKEDEARKRTEVELGVVRPVVVGGKGALAARSLRRGKRGRDAGDDSAHALPRQSEEAQDRAHHEREDGHVGGARAHRLRDVSHETVFAQHLDRLGGAGVHHAAHDLGGLEHDGAAGRGNERRALGAADRRIDGKAGEIFGQRRTGLARVVGHDHGARARIGRHAGDAGNA